MKIIKNILKAILSLVIGFGIGMLIASLWFDFQEKELVKEITEAYGHDTCYQYHYSKLDEEDQDTYRRLYYAFSTFSEEITIKENNVDEATKVYYAVLDDHPEFYYIKMEYEYYEGDEIVILPTYQYSKEEVEQFNQQITKNTQDIINQVKNQKNEIDKIETAYEYIIENTTYKANENDQHMLSVFVQKESVCAGYAKAYQYILNKAGVDASYIAGKSKETDKEKSEGHAWVMIHFNNDYYYSDPTWGDIEDKDMKHPCKAYFFMGSDEMLKHYKPDLFYEGTIGDYNYFKDIGCYLEEYDRKAVSNAVKYSLFQEINVVEIKCANKEVYKQLENKIENEYLAYYVLKENDCYSVEASYSCDEKNLMIEIYY